MEDLKSLSLADPVDLLIEQTNRHAHLRALGASHDQMTVSREILKNPQAEMELKKLVENNNHSCFLSQDQPSAWV